MRGAAQGKAAMGNDLYFLDMLVKALKSQDARTSIKDALEEIKHLAKQPGYDKGYRQFELFMEEILKENNEIQTDRLRRILLEQLNDHNQAKPGNKELAEDLKKLLEQAGQKCLCHIELLLDDKQIESFDIQRFPCTHCVQLTSGGSCKIVMHTGMVIWAGQIDSDKLLISEKKQNRVLRLAADSGHGKHKPTWELDLPGLRLKTFAGLEKGTLQIEFLTS
jgi:hypothetical protein